MSTKLQQLKTYVQMDRIPEALEGLLELAQGTNSEQIVILQSASYNRLKREINSGVISSENAKIEMNRVVNALLYVIEQLQKELPDENNDSPTEFPGKDRQYNIQHILQLLNEAFNDSDLETFCMAHFEKVFNGFGLGQSKNQKVMALVDYAKRHLEMEKLLELMKTENPAQYEIHKPYY